MKYIIIIICVICALLGIGVALYIALSGIGKDTPQATEPVSVFPNGPGSATVSTLQMSLRMKNGETRSVSDVRVGIERLDYHMDGPFYVIHTEPTTRVRGGFQILFFERTQEFQITLFAEPLGVVRDAAVATLAGKLGVEQGKLCDVLVRVFAVDTVRAELADTDLGLPQCGGRSL